MLTTLNTNKNNIPREYRCKITLIHIRTARKICEQNVNAFYLDFASEVSSPLSSVNQLWN